MTCNSCLFPRCLFFLSSVQNILFFGSFCPLNGWDYIARLPRLWMWLLVWCIWNIFACNPDCPNHVFDYWWSVTYNTCWSGNPNYQIFSVDVLGSLNQCNFQFLLHPRCNDRYITITFWLSEWVLIWLDFLCSSLHCTS